MTMEQLKNILIENKSIASDEWNYENPFVSIDLNMLYDIFEKEKQRWIGKVCEMHKCTKEFMLKQLEVWEDYYLNNNSFKVADALNEIITWFRSPENTEEQL